MRLQLQFPHAAGLPRSGCFQHRRLEGGPASLVMRREPALHDARLDAMAKKFAGREQSGRTAPHDQDGRCGCGQTILTGIHQSKIFLGGRLICQFRGQCNRCRTRSTMVRSPVGGPSKQRLERETETRLEPVGSQIQPKCGRFHRHVKKTQPRRASDIIFSAFPSRTRRSLLTARSSLWRVRE